MLDRRGLIRRAGLAAAAQLGVSLFAGCESDSRVAPAPLTTPSRPPTVLATRPSPTAVPIPTSTSAPAPAGEPTPAVGDRAARLASVTSWVYQLQNVDPRDLGAGGFDLAVIDYAADDGEPWSAADLRVMKSDGLVVLAYLSIGEAESYRPYWTSNWDADRDGEADSGAPGWLLDQNPDWEGNYRVQYWDPEWQAIVVDYLSQIVGAGFDGVYLDIVDAYEFWEEQGRSEAAGEMAGFIEMLARAARERDPGFLVFPQNAPGILGSLDPNAASSYLAAVDGIGAEDSFFYGEEEEDNPYEPQTETIAFLDRFVEVGKTVLAVDYLTDPDKVSRFYEESRAHNYVPYAGVRALDRTIPQPGD